MDVLCNMDKTDKLCELLQDNSDQVELDGDGK